MKKLILAVALMMTFCGSGVISQPAFAQSYGINALISSTSAASITDANATHSRSRGVWIGTSQNLDFSFDGSTWVTLQGATAGTVIPIQVVGARITSGAAAPNSGDVVFLY